MLIRPYVRTTKYGIYSMRYQSVIHLLFSELYHIPDCTQARDTQILSINTIFWLINNYNWFIYSSYYTITKYTIIQISTNMRTLSRETWNKKIFAPSYKTKWFVQFWFKIVLRFLSNKVLQFWFKTVFQVWFSKVLQFWFKTMLQFWFSKVLQLVQDSASVLVQDNSSILVQ